MESSGPDAPTPRIYLPQPDVNSSGRQRALAFFTMLTMGLLAGPATLLFALITVPIGIGIVLLMSGLDWVMYLYPFEYVGVMAGKKPVYFITGALAHGATLLQWVVVAWLYSLFAYRWKTKNIVYAALLVLAALAFIQGLMLHLAGLDVVYERAHM
jgi:hypothetical protein